MIMDGLQYSILYYSILLYSIVQYSTVKTAQYVDGWMDEWFILQT